MVKRLLVLGIFTFGLVTQAQAGASGFFGISYVLGTSLGDFGVTAKVLSDDDENTGVLGAGVSYYPFSEANKFGVDASVGYLFQNSAVTLGWDFLRMKPQLGIGYIDTEDGGSTPAASSPAASSPAPSTPAPPPEPEGGGSDET